MKHGAAGCRGVSEAYVTEGYRDLVRLAALVSRHDHGLSLKHLVYTLGRRHSARDRGKEHSYHHYRHNYLRYVGDRRHNSSRAHSASRDVCDVNAADEYYRDDSRVHNNRQHGVHYCHHLLHLDIGVAKLSVRLLEAFVFVFLAHVRLYDSRARHVLLNHRVDTVKLLLDPAKDRHGSRQNKGEHYRHYRQSAKQHEAELYVERAEHYRAADKEHRRANEHSQKHLGKVDYHSDIVGHSRYERAGGEFVGLLDRERHYLFVRVASEIIAKSLRCLCRGVGAEHAEKSAYQHHNEHKYSKGEYDLHRAVRALAPENFHHGRAKLGLRDVARGVNSAVHDHRHKLWQKQICHYLAYHQQRRDYRKKRVWLQISEHSFHSFSSLSCSDRRF